MTITKEAVAGVETQGNDSELNLLNQFSKIPLTAEQVYLFGVKLCDNQVDRDNEYFDQPALETLATLFVGKTGIFDHEWSAKNQTARIYRTELVTEGGLVPETGETSCFLKGYAYMLRTEGNADLIAEIDAGIKKEVSVSCAVTRAVCSICGNDITDRTRCSHVKGRMYENTRCVARLEEPTDAFEWSFVAVPAQRNAGVVKGLKREIEKQCLSLLPDEAWKQIEKEAAYGRKYLAQLRTDVVRLGLLAEIGLTAKGLSDIAERLELPELEQMKTAYEEQVTKRFPPPVQLRYGTQSQKGQANDNVFLI